MIVMQIRAQELRDSHHSAWSSDSEPGAVFDIQQSPDGYLRLTTSRGVFRFDGVRFQSADEITSGATQRRGSLIWKRRKDYYGFYSVGTSGR
jgi:hypothetical protein